VLQSGPTSETATSRAKLDRPASQSAAEASLVTDAATFKMEVTNQNKSLSATKAVFKVETETAIN